MAFVSIFFLQAIFCPLTRGDFKGRLLARITSPAVAEQRRAGEPDVLDPTRWMPNLL
jgi:hypothetical protein